MKRRGGVIRIKKCRIAGKLLWTTLLGVMVMLLAFSLLWNQRLEFERQLSLPNQESILSPIRMTSPRSASSKVHLASDNTRGDVIRQSSSRIQEPTSLVHTGGSIHQKDEISQDQRQLAESMSSADYFSCCGLGHRLSKMTDAYYVAKKLLNFQFRVYWASCEVSGHDNTTTTTTTTTDTNEQTKNPTSIEVFHYFFGPQPFSEIQDLQRKQNESNHCKDHVLRFNNEIPGFKKFKRQSDEFYYVPIPQKVDNETTIPSNRTTSQEVCPCRGLGDFFHESAGFHQSLKDRFVQRHPALVNYWRDRFQFANHTVYGLHVRGGNGEDGDFLRKNRGLDDWEAWSTSMADLIAKMIRHHKDWTTKPPLFFLATDTDSILHELQRQLEGIVTVVSLPQEREGEGNGVAFGNDIIVDGKCLEKWQNSILDMMLLSDADVIIAGRPSSFTQSLPMSISLSRSNDTFIKAPYCEVNRNATLCQCFSNFEDWCCKGKSSFHMEGIRPGYEYRRLPLALHEQDFAIQPRPTTNFQKVQLDPSFPKRRIPLPYDWGHL